MRHTISYFVTFSQLILINTVFAQAFDLACTTERGYAGKTLYYEDSITEDSSSTKLSVVPIVALGLGGLVTGGIIGEHINGGGPFEITKAERNGMLIGTAVGVTLGYFLAKRAQSKHPVKENK